MKAYKIVAVAIVLLLSTVRLCAQGNSSGNNSSAVQTSLTEVLAKIGKDYDCFFTLEDAWLELGTTHVLELEASPISVASGKKSLREELDALHKTVPNLNYQFDRNNPRIVHVIDASLPQQRSYALNARLKSLNFKGTVGELVNVIKKQGVPLSLEVVLVTSEAAVQDDSTLVTVKGRALNVREALSNFIPLNKRKSRIIWIARTRLERGGITYVQFR